MNSPILFSLLACLLGEIFIETAGAAANTPAPGAVVYDIDATINALPARVLSDEFSSGPYLIYDCRAQTFICVNEDSFDLCRRLRIQSQGEGKRILDCAPLKNYISENACGNAAQTAIDQLAAKNFCYGQYPPKATPTPTPPPPTEPATPILL
jgi:hypothetical protein